MEQPPQQNNESGEDDPEREARRAGLRIWVGSLADYNQGRLHGSWMAAAQDVQTLRRAVAQMLEASPTPGAEEFAIFDYSGFGPLQLGQYADLDVVARLAQGIVDHGTAFAHYAKLLGFEPIERLQHFEEAYEGHYSGLTEYGLSVIEGFGFNEAISGLEVLMPYIRIDARAFALDMKLGGMIETSERDDGIYVFNSSW